MQGLRLASTAGPTPNDIAAAVTWPAAPTLRASPKPAATAAAQAPALRKPTKRTFKVQRKGFGSWAEVAIRDALSVVRLKKMIKKELELDERLDNITVRLMAAGSMDTSVELDSMDTVHDALEKAKKSLSVDMNNLCVFVTGAPTTTAAAAADPTAAAFGA